MIGLDKITARIEADAVAEAAVIAQDAQAQCAQLRADADKQAQERYWTLAREGMKSVEERAQRLSKAADMEARKTILAFKQETVSGVFDAAQQRLLTMPEADYVRFMADKAVRASVTGREELVLNAKDKAALGEKVLAEANGQLAEAGKTAALTLAPETGDFLGGLIVRQGSVSVNCTVDTLVEQARSDLASEVAVVLFN